MEGENKRKIADEPTNPAPADRYKRTNKQTKWKRIDAEMWVLIQFSMRKYGKRIVIFMFQFLKKQKAYNMTNDASLYKNKKNQEKKIEGKMV